MFFTSLQKRCCHITQCFKIVWKQEEGDNNSDLTEHDSKAVSVTHNEINESIATVKKTSLFVSLN